MVNPGLQNAQEERIHGAQIWRARRPHLLADHTVGVNPTERKGPAALNFVTPLNFFHQSS